MKGSGAAFVSAFATSIKNFDPVHRGKVVGILAASFGISSALFTSLFAYVFRGNLLLFLLCVSIVTFVVPMLGIAFLGVNPQMQDTSTSSSLDNEMDESQLEEHDETRLNRIKSLIIRNIIPPSTNQENYNPIQMILTFDFWLYCCMFFAGIGSGVVVFNNLGSMVVSYGGHNGEQSKFVIILSLSNCLGRIFFGFISDRFAATATRVTFLNITLMGMW